jgi:signal peptidase I
MPQIPLNANDRSAGTAPPIPIDAVVAALTASGHAVRFRAPGHSMHPTIRSGEVINVRPIAGADARVGDILLYRSPGGVTAHRLVRVHDRRPERSSAPRSLPRGRPAVLILRGDNSCCCDAPVESDRILGKVIAVERNGRDVDPSGLRARLIFHLRRLLRGILSVPGPA